jgi:replication factor A1
LKIKELRDKMRNVTIEGKVMEKSDAHEVLSRFKDETYKVASAIIGDETGTIKMPLWNEQIDKVNVDNMVKVENGYVSSFRGEIQLNVGKFGKLTVE